mgnify:CR=1 FL=1
MNERNRELIGYIDVNAKIRELAEQAGCKIDRLGYGEGNLEKFAEFVVRECAMLVETLSPGYNDYRDQIENAFRRDCVDNIKQHFGFE